MSKWVVGIILVLWSLEGLAGQPRFQQWRPVRKGIRHDSSVVQDIFSHAESEFQGPHGFLTVVHETQHRATSGARAWALRRYRKPVEVLYCLDDRVLVFEKPVKTTVSRVAQSVPASLRGGVYGIYLVKYDRGWENAPVMLLDEWTAYTHELMAREELGLTEDPASLGYATELMVYSSILSMLEPDNAEIADYVQWNSRRSLGLTRDSEVSKSYLQKLDRPENAKIKAHMVFRLGLDILGP